LNAVKEIGAIEATSRLGQILEWVEAGEEVVITRRGRVIARMVPPARAFDRERSRRATQRIRAMRHGVTLGGLALKDLISEGRL
jgi:prevent-host-death family protein